MSKENMGKKIHFTHALELDIFSRETFNAALIVPSPTFLAECLKAIRMFLITGDIKQVSTAFKPYMKTVRALNEVFYKRPINNMGHSEQSIIRQILDELDIPLNEQDALFQKGISLRALFKTLNISLYNKSKHHQIERILSKTAKSQVKKWSTPPTILMGVGLLAQGGLLAFCSWASICETLIKFANLCLSPVPMSMIILVTAAIVALLDVSGTKQNHKISSKTCKNNIMLAIMQFSIKSLPQVINLTVGLPMPFLIGSLAIIGSLLEMLKARNVYNDALNNMNNLQVELNKQIIEEADPIKLMQESTRIARNLQRFAIGALSSRKEAQLHLITTITSIFITAAISFTAIGMIGYGLMGAAIIFRMLLPSIMNNRAQTDLSKAMKATQQKFDEISLEDKDAILLIKKTVDEALAPFKALKTPCNNNKEKKCSQSFRASFFQPSNKSSFMLPSHGQAQSLLELPELTERAARSNTLAATA